MVISQYISHYIIFNFGHAHFGKMLRRHERVFRGSHISGCLNSFFDTINNSPSPLPKFLYKTSISLWGPNKCNSQGITIFHIRFENDQSITKICGLHLPHYSNSLLDLLHSVYILSPSNILLLEYNCEPFSKLNLCVL